MKKLLITAMVSLLAVGSASANYETDSKVDLLYSQDRSSSVNLQTLPATAAGRDQKIEAKVFYGGMQDDPSERPSGI